MLASQLNLSQTLKSIGEPNRLRILCLLMQAKELCVSDVSSTCGLSIATTSHHLKVLEKVGLVSGRRNGKEICYSLEKSPFIKDLKKLICTYDSKSNQ